MIDETLQRLEERIRSSQRTSDAAKGDLLALVDELRGELAGIAEQREGDATALADGADAAAATAEEGGSAALESLLELENTHPRAVALVRSFLQTLADAGI